MGDLALNIAASGLDAQQTAMDTIAQNLANANTPGYISETPNIVTSAGSDALGIGDGVRTIGISQTSDGLLAANAQQTQGSLSQSTALQQVLMGAQAVFPEPSASGLSADLSSFWQSWDAVDQNPSALAPRTEVIDLAQNLCTDLQQASVQLTNLQSNAQSQLGTLVGEANTLLGQVANLNTQIVATEGSGAPANALIDQRNQVMNQLAQDIGAVGRPQPDGTLTVSVGGITLVQGTWSDTLSAQGAPGGMSLVARSSGASIPASAGQAAGLLAGLNQYLPSYQSQLDTVANDLASTVNTQLAAGWTAPGATGSGAPPASGAGYPLFTGTGAAGLSLNAAVVANPQLIAASDTSATPDATNNGGNAQAMATLFDSATGPDQAYRSLIQGLGAQVQACNNQVETQTSVANAAKENLQAVVGVNTNSEMVTMLTYQQAYQASAKMVSTVEAMMQSLLQAI